jgi:hypothetical protein
MEQVDTIRVEVARQYKTRSWQTIDFDLGPAKLDNIDLIARKFMVWQNWPPRCLASSMFETGRPGGTKAARGYRRIQGAMSNLGHKLARSTIAAILRRHTIEPAPERNRKTTWKKFPR